MRKKREAPWSPTGVVSDTCEKFVGGARQQCGRPAVLAYPAMGGGYFSMCDECCRGHEFYSVTIGAAKRGETPNLPSHISTSQQPNREAAK